MFEDCGGGVGPVDGLSSECVALTGEKALLPSVDCYRYPCIMRRRALGVCGPPADPELSAAAPCFIIRNLLLVLHTSDSVRDFFVLAAFRRNLSDGEAWALPSCY